MEPEPKKDWAWEALLITTLVTIIAVYLILAPAITHNPSIITSLLNRQIVEALLIPGFLFFLLFGLVFTMFQTQCEIDANPLSTEEKNDPLTREVIVKGSLDHAYELCRQSLYEFPSSRWYTLPDRSNRALIAWPLWGKNTTKINFSFSQLDENRIRVVISAATYNRGYSDDPGGVNKQRRERRPNRAYGSDRSRRIAIYSLNKIQQYFRSN